MRLRQPDGGFQAYNMGASILLGFYMGLI
jgi:hypothetical protein